MRLYKISIFLILGCLGPLTWPNEKTGLIAVNQSAEIHSWREAKLRGVSFRALGYQPNWLLEIVNKESITFHLSTQNHPFVFAYQKPAFDALRHTYEFTLSANEGIVIYNRACIDDRTGHAFTSFIEVSVAGHRLSGCGLKLEAL